LEAGDGGVFAFGGAPFLGSAAGRCTLAQCFGFAATGTGGGYWVLDSSPANAPGGAALYGFGDATDVTVASGGANATAVASTPSGKGGWVLDGSTGRVVPFGDAHSFGDGTGIAHRGGTWAPFGSNIPYFSGIAATPDGGGYWLVGIDGGVFAFGDAGFYGSMGDHPLAAPVEGIAPSTDGRGYRLVSFDGGVFAFGDASFAGSMGGQPLAAPMIGIATGPSGGYWTVAQDGGVFAFGGAPFLGSLAGRTLARPVYGIAPPAAS
jgi:hypothetical protein